MSGIAELQSCFKVRRIYVVILSHSTIACSERQVNTAQWNMNGNWLATGAIDGFVKLYDIRTMKEFETWRINQGEDSVSNFFTAFDNKYCMLLICRNVLDL